MWRYPITEVHSYFFKARLLILRLTVRTPDRWKSLLGIDLERYLSDYIYDIIEVVTPPFLSAH